MTLDPPFHVLPPEVVLKGSGSAKFSSEIRKVTFEDAPSAYKPGIPYQGKVTNEKQRPQISLTTLSTFCYQ